MADARSAFTPGGPTVFVAANTTAINGVLVDTTDTSPKLHGTQFRVVNPHINAVVHFAWGASNTAAANAAVAANASTTQNSYCIPPLSTTYITAPRGQYWSALCAALNTNLFITPGTGGL